MAHRIGPKQRAALNAWPGGSRRLACLRCERPFRSRSKLNRLCPMCHKDTRGMVDGEVPAGSVTHRRLASVPLGA